MEQNLTGDKYSDAMQWFCEECRKIDFQKLFHFNATDITSDWSKIFLGSVKSKIDSNCWLCNQRARKFWNENISCSLYLMNVRLLASQSWFHVLDRGSQSEVMPCLYFEKDDSFSGPNNSFTFAWVSLQDLGHAFVTVNPVSPSLDVSFVQASIAFCQKNHDDCCIQPSQSVEGMKLIDCDTMEITQSPGAVPYVALSYVWGHQMTRCLPTYGSLEFATLPQTIQDSLTTIRRLGFRYLWVDKLCISQGNVAERRKQVMQMDKIYAGAELTIVAAAGEDDEFGQ
jgi:hypothetical protein